MAEIFENPELLIQKAKNSKTFKMVSIAVSAIAVLILAWFMYKKFVFEPADEKSKTVYWQAMVHLENGDNDKALEEFGRIAKKYDGKKGGEVAQYMAGRLYMDKGNFKKALKYLEKAKVQDLYIGTFIIGLQGDCQSELGKYKDAIKLYEKAAKRKANEMTTPLYLMKAALLYETKLNDFQKAESIYKQIEMDYYDYFTTNNVEKYLYRAANKVKK